MVRRNVIDLLADDSSRACQYLEQHGGTATPPQLHDPHRTAPKC
jgi:glutamate decarboxylase